MTDAPRRTPDDGAPDRDLVGAAVAGDRRALEVLLRRHHQRLHLLCRRMCADRGDAEDATQEALVAIVRGLPRYDGRAEFTTWSYRVTTNACLDQLRRRARRPLPADPTVPESADGSGMLGTRPPAATEDPASGAVAADQRSRLQAALAQLPESFRVPVVLRDVAELDYAEIAEVLDLPPGTVRSRISRGRARLAELLPELRPGGTDDIPESRDTDAAAEPVDRSGNRAPRPDVRPGDAS